MSSLHTLDTLVDLSTEDRARLAHFLHCENLIQGDTLYECGQPMTRVYLPLTATVEEVLPMPDGPPELLRRVERGAMAGSCMLADPGATRTARVVHSGEAWSMAYADFTTMLEQTPRFRAWVMQDALVATVRSMNTCNSV